MNTRTPTAAVSVAAIASRKCPPRWVYRSVAARHAFPACFPCSAAYPFAFPRSELGERLRLILDPWRCASLAPLAPLSFQFDALASRRAFFLAHVNAPDGGYAERLPLLERQAQ